jgi:hypothetical protein
MGIGMLFELHLVSANEFAAAVLALLTQVSFPLPFKVVHGK